MSPETVTGFKNYTPELIYDLRGLFAHEKINSRPVKYEDVIIWLDADQGMHRDGYPAVEREDGTCEYWIHGTRQYEGDKTCPK